MKKARISELKNHLSKFLNYVRNGEQVVVLDRGRPIAEILPRRSTSGSSDEQLSKLEAQGILRRGNPRKLKDYPYPEGTTEGSGVLKALLEERAATR